MEVVKKDKCPKCKSKHIHTMGVDQFCLDCDWMNTAYVVNSGLFEEEIAEQEELLRVELERVQQIESSPVRLKTFEPRKSKQTA